MIVTNVVRAALKMSLMRIHVAPAVGVWAGRPSGAVSVCGLQWTWSVVLWPF